MFKPLRFSLFAVCINFAIPAFACLNEYTFTEPPLHEHKLQLKALLHRFDTARPYWAHGFHDEESRYREDLALTTDINKLHWKTRSDYAVQQLKTGDQKRALAILEDLYRSHPTEYNILANLGTAYELHGDKIKALELLRKAVAINPRSHYESEWIHIRLLEQEVSGAPDYKKIINLGVGSFPEWLIDKTYKFPRDADSLKLQIAFQLHERIGFIAPPNKAIGQLVTDFADIVAKTDSLGAAKEFYQFALSYDSTLKDTVAARIRGVESSQKEVKDTFRWATVVWAIPLVALLMIFFAWLKSMRNQKKAEL